MTDMYCSRRRSLYIWPYEMFNELHNLLQLKSRCDADFEFVQMFSGVVHDYWADSSDKRLCWATKSYTFP